MSFPVCKQHNTSLLNCSPRTLDRMGTSAQFYTEGNKSRTRPQAFLTTDQCFRDQPLTPPGEPAASLRGRWDPSSDFQASAMEQGVGPLSGNQAREGVTWPTLVSLEVMLWLPSTCVLQVTDACSFVCLACEGSRRKPSANKSKSERLSNHFCFSDFSLS